MTAANLPDADAVLGFANRDFFLFQHRGFTHSLSGLLVQSLVLAWFFMAASTVKNFGVLFGLSLLGLASNACLDLTNSWGTMILWPFTSRWFALGWIAMADPVVWGILAAGLAAGFLRPAASAGINRASLAVLAAYCVLCGAGQRMAKEHFRESLARVRAVPQRIEAYPLVFAPFKWNVVASAPEKYYQGYVHALNGLEGRLRVFFRNPVPPSLAGPFAAAYERRAGAPLVRPLAGEKDGVMGICDLKFLGRREGMPFVVKLYLDGAGRPARQWLGFNIAPPVADQEYELQ